MIFYGTLLIFFFFGNAFAFLLLKRTELKQNFQKDFCEQLVQLHKQEKV